MRKKLVLPVCMTLFLILCGCDTSSSSNNTLPRTWIDNSTRKLMNEGDTLLSTTATSYGVNDNTKKIADYILFPFSGADDISQPFSIRMKNQIDTVNGLSNTMALFSQLISADIVKKRKSIFKNRATTPSDIQDAMKPILKKGLDKLIDEIPGNFGLKLGLKAALEFMPFLKGPDPIEELQKTLDQFRMETQSNFYVLNNKIDTIISSVDRGFANVTTMLADIEIDNAIDSFNAAVAGLSFLYDPTELSNVAYIYFVQDVSSGYLSDLNNFITAAKRVQQTYVSTLPSIADTNCVITRKVELESYMTNDPWGNPGFWVIPQNYTSASNCMFPLKRLPINLASLYYLIKMIDYRFAMNAILQTGDSYDSSNVALASYFLTLLNDSGIIQQTKDAYSGFYNDFFWSQTSEGRQRFFCANYLLPALYDSESPANMPTKVYLKGSRVYIGSNMVHCNTNYLIDATLPTGVTHPSAMSNAFDPIAEFGTIYPMLLSNHDDLYWQYLGVFVANVIALEVRLKSYL